ncbi:MAG TPA: SRPBCC family protein [Alphaproteobacteria bacterium]|jgi:uncharacterized protein YndB with AHSA1/START domain|nr:SRPBCC family protein [Alphaproteobacteria bacterium]
MTDALTVTPTGDRGVIIAQTFDAKAAPLFKTWTTPDLLKHWLLGPPGWTMTVCEVDLKPGGAYRYKWRNAEGTEIGLGGVYREVAVPSRLVATERFDPPFDQGEAVLTLMFDERDGRTTITNTAVYATPEARDGMLASGMERGIKASYDRLAEMVR